MFIQLVKKSPTFTDQSVHHYANQSQPKSLPSISYSHNISLLFILTLPFHLYLCLSSGLFPLVFQHKFCTLSCLSMSLPSYPFNNIHMISINIPFTKLPHVSRSNGTCSEYHKMNKHILIPDFFTFTVITRPALTPT